MKFLDSIPFWGLLLVALAMGIAPAGAQPHLLQKLSMLVQGSLTRPMDIFDLFLHGIFPLLLLAKLVRMWQQRTQEGTGQDDT